MTQSNNILTCASIYPTEISAGNSDEFSIKFKVGPDYTKAASRIVFDFSCTLGTSCPTRELNECSGYVEAYINNPEVDYNIRCWDLDHKHFVDSGHKASREAMRMVALDISAGLRENDSIELRWGETLGGFGPGAKVSTVVPRPDYLAHVEVRYFDSQEKGMPDHGRDYLGYKRPMPDASVKLEYKILPREPRRARLLRNSNSTVLIPYDVFWNVAKVEDVPQIAECDCAAEKNPFGGFEFENKNINIKSKGLPFTESAPMENAFENYNIYWGDMHTHSAYSIDCAQRSGMDMTPARLMDYARYASALDFFAVTDHHQPQDEPMRHLPKSEWDDTLKAVAQKNEEGKFVVFPGIEFRNEFGDVCLIFNCLPEYEKITQSHFKRVKDFYANFNKETMMSISHFHGPGRMPFGEWRPDAAATSPAIEIYSDHGSYEREKVTENGRAWSKQFRSDRCAEFFLKNNYRHAHVANSDDHKGHVGVNGLTAVFAKELTREAIFEAYYQRRVYATTNARIKLVFTANGHLMGSVVPFTENKLFHISAQGENTLKKVEIFKNGDLFKLFKNVNGKDFAVDFECKSDSPDNWYVRVTQVDNHIAYSSPVWFE